MGGAEDGKKLHLRQGCTSPSLLATAVELPLHVSCKYRPAHQTEAVCVVIEIENHSLNLRKPKNPFDLCYMWAIIFL